MSCLENVLGNLDHVYLTVDAVDESNPRHDLLRVLRDLVTDNRFSKIQLLVTSREYLDIENFLMDISTPVSMKNPALDEDIRLYSEIRLGKNHKIAKWPEHLKDEALKALIDGAKGMFRWVVCQIDILARLRGDFNAVQKELKRLPKNIDDAYDRIFEEIRPEHRETVNLTLKWICFHTNNNEYADGEINLDILLEAVSADMDIRNLPQRNYRYNEEDMRELCGCLVRIESDAKTVSFAHYTVMEYLALKEHLESEKFFSASPGSMFLDVASCIFKAALCPEDRNSWEHAHQTEDSRQTPTLSFTNYSMWMVLWAVQEYDDIMAERDDLVYAVSLWCNLSSSHFQEYLGNDLNEFFGWTDNKECFKITWVEKPSQDVRFIMDLFRLNCHIMALRAIERAGPEVLHAPVYISLPDPFDECYGQSSGGKFFKGALVESFAFLSGLWENGIAFQRICVPYTASLDPEMVLVAHLASGDSMSGITDALAKSLAASTSKRRRLCVTPLQAAVAAVDVIAVRSILDSGADPAEKANPESQLWEQNDVLSIFNGLGELTPLEIFHSSSFLTKQYKGFRHSFSDIGLQNILKMLNEAYERKRRHSVDFILNDI
ncbi:hypothetical protein CGCSCA5_v006619 [Colletotrichum siamense]|nr:hypothetical protein CGCSCA5_v006619 [Colletotrichum siamense]